MSGRIMQTGRFLFIVIFSIFFLNVSFCFSASRITSLDDLAKKISGKILLSTSNDIVIIDLSKKDISYLVHNKASASYPKWGPGSGSVTYFQHRIFKQSLSSNDIGDIKIMDSDGRERVLVSGIKILELKGFIWSKDKKRLAYLVGKGELNIIDAMGKSIESIDLLSSTSEKLIYASHAIFSSDEKNIIFIGLINNGHIPYPMGIYEYNIETKSSRKIKQVQIIYSIALSPNGEDLAYINSNGLYLLNMATNLERRLVDVQHCLYNFCTWSPDGSKILYGYPRSNWVMEEPILEVYMIDINTKDETILINEKMLQQEININELHCENIDWIN